jgi:hypothetical protein
MFVLVASGLFGGDEVSGLLRAKPIGLVSTAPCPESVCNGIVTWGEPRPKPGFCFNYQVASGNLIGIKRDSLEFEFLRTAKGEDILKKPDGTPACHLGVGDRIEFSRDGKNYCIFSVRVDGNQFGKVETLQFRGTVTALCTAKLEESRCEFNAAEAAQREMGPFTMYMIPDTAAYEAWARKTFPDAFAVSEAGESQGPIVGQAGVKPKIVTLMLCNMKPSNKGEVIVILQGDMMLLKDIQIRAGGWKCDLSNTSIARQEPPLNRDVENCGYHIPKPSNGKVSVELQYWTDVKEIKVAFDSEKPDQPRP